MDRCILFSLVCNDATRSNNCPQIGAKYSKAVKLSGSPSVPHGIVDYIVTKMKQRSTVPAGLMVLEAKLKLTKSKDYIPQAVGEMYACAKSLRSAPHSSISGLYLITTTLP